MHTHAQTHYADYSTDFITNSMVFRCLFPATSSASFEWIFVCQLSIHDVIIRKYNKYASRSGNPAQDFQHLISHTHTHRFQWTMVVFIANLNVIIFRTKCKLNRIKNVQIIETRERSYNRMSKKEHSTLSQSLVHSQ